MRAALKAVAGKQCVHDETLLTLMAEVESLMNGRPLTHVSTDCRNEENLTPNHFLLGGALLETLAPRMSSSAEGTPKVDKRRPQCS